MLAPKKLIMVLSPTTTTINLLVYQKKKKAINLLLFFGTYACEIVSLVLVAFALIPICGAQFFNLRIRIHLILVVWTLDYKHRMVIFLFFINVKLIMPTA